MRVTGFLTTNTVPDPESHAHSALVDFLTHSFDLSYAVQIVLGATFISILHVDYTINRRWSRALGTIEGEIPSPAATMTAIEAKVAIPENAQASFVWLFFENTFLKKKVQILRNQNKVKQEMWAHYIANNTAVITK